MRRLRLFPKTFLYTLGLLLLLVFIAHALLYFLAPQVPLDLSTGPDSGDAQLVARLNLTPYITQMILKVLPVSLLCCVLVSVLCSLLFSRGITVPIKQISAAAERMAHMDRSARCGIRSGDEIGVLAENLNDLYQNLLAAMEDLESEKRRVSDLERSKVDFLRAASHELKTPLTALNAMLENMVLGIGKYRNHQIYLPECLEMTGRLIHMVQEILETSRLSGPLQEEAPVRTELGELLPPLCRPYELIAKSRGVRFHLDLTGGFSAPLPPRLFGKVVSNLAANAVAYTDPGGTASIYFEARSLVVENECAPLPAEVLERIFQPFYRPDFARNRDDGGNGLGLYLVQTLLRAMDLPYSFEPMGRPPGMRFVIFFQEPS